MCKQGTAIWQSEPQHLCVLLARRAWFVIAADQGEAWRRTLCRATPGQQAIDDFGGLPASIPKRVILVPARVFRSNTFFKITHKRGIRVIF